VLREAAAAECRDCRAKVRAYTAVGKRAATCQHEELGWLMANEFD